MTSSKGRGAQVAEAGQDQVLDEIGLSGFEINDEPPVCPPPRSHGSETILFDIFNEPQDISEHARKVNRLVDPMAAMQVMDAELLASSIALELSRSLKEDFRELLREELGGTRVNGPVSCRPTPSGNNDMEVQEDDAALAKRDYPTPSSTTHWAIGKSEYAMRWDDDSLHEDPVAPSMEKAFFETCPVLQRAARRALTVVSVVGTLGKHRAPLREDFISRFVDSTVFHAIVNIVIMVNVVFMVYAANESVSDYNTGASDFVNYGEIVFFCGYLLELVLRLWRFGRHYWVDSNWFWNWLDAFLVFASFWYMTFESLLPNVSFLRMQRLFKLAKILRVIRFVRMFKTLRGILNSIVGTVSTLAWSIIMLYVILFMFALTFVLITGSYLQEKGSSLDDEEREQLLETFGSVNKATLSLYMLISGGQDWSYYYDRVSLTGPIGAALLILFTAFAQIAVLNVILGFFVRTAMESMHATPEEEARAHAEDQRKLAKDFAELVGRADVSKDGLISPEEWRESMKDGAILDYLDLVGLARVDVVSLFENLSQETDDGNVDLHTFTLGCMMMKHKASKFDVRSLQLEIKGMQQALQTMRPGSTTQSSLRNTTTTSMNKSSTSLEKL
jgi:hypothetical protein